MSPVLRSLLLCFAFIGNAAAQEGELPFTVTIPEGWMLSTLQGVSSAPEDRALGVRQRAQWIGAEGTATMEFTCMWLKGTPDVADEMDRIAAALADGVRANGMTFDASPVTTQQHGADDWRGFDGGVSADGESIGRQRVVVRAGERCFFSATLAGTPDAYALQEPMFERALATLRELPAR